MMSLAALRHKAEHSCQEPRAIDRKPAPLFLLNQSGSAYHILARFAGAWFYVSRAHLASLTKAGR